MNNMEKQNPFLEQEIDIREYLNILYRRRWLIFSSTIIFCTVSLIYSFMMKPVYQGKTRILIEKEAPRIVNMEEVTPVNFSTREYYKTQYKILKSRVIAERVNKTIGGYVPWDKWGGRKKKGSENSSLIDENRISALLGRILIKPIPNTQLVEIVSEDIDPELAAKIADLWAENYIAYVLDTKFDASQYASGWLQNKIKEAKENLESTEMKLQEYRRANNIVDKDENRNIRVLDQLLKRKAELEIEVSEKSEHFKEKHPEIIGLKSELASVVKKIDTEKDKEILTKDKEIQYNILKRDVETNRQVYESLLKRIKETEVTGGLKTTNIRIIDKATIPGSAVRPRKKLNLIIALILGLFGGGSLAFVIEGLDQSLKTPEDVKNRLKLPALASIAMPTSEEDKGVQPEFITSTRPHSTISEAYRSLRTSIMFTSVEHKRKILAFTSSGPQEGKTTSTINLAIVMAQAGEKTVLVDADLRQPRVEKAFGYKIENGLSEVLVNAKTLDEVVHNTNIENLDVIACGAIPPNPSELLSSKRMDDFLKELSQRYDRIIIDTPPVLAVTDAVVLSGKVDGTILVVKAGETNRNASLKTKEIIESVKSSNLIGAVLNMVETGQAGGYYYYYYYGRYGKYGDAKKKHKKNQTA